MRKNESGIAHLLLLLLLVAVAVVGFAAYRVRTAAPKTSTSPVTTLSTQLSSSNKELDQADSQLDADLNDAALNSDLQSM